MNISQKVSVDNLSISYKNDEQIVKNINFSLNEGELLLLIGKTGTGKTSILNVLAGNTPRLIKAKVEGNVRINGIDPRDSPSEVLLRNVGLVPQEPSDGVIGDTVEDEVLLSLMFRNDDADVEGWLRLFNLERLYERTTFTLSAGETQKLAILSRVLLNAHVLLFDEPTTYLDEESREGFKEVVFSLLKAGKTVIITGHGATFWDNIPKKIVELPRKAEEVNVEEFSRIEVDRLNKMTYVKVKGLEYQYYPSKVPIFKNINLSFDGPGIILLKGPNGSGKTTFLKLLSGIVRPKRGKIEMSHSALFIPDNPLLYFSKPTPKEELELFAGNLKKEEKERLLKIKIFAKKMKELSSGERRLISLISASLSHYPIILMDEPTVGLDPEYKSTVLDIFKKLSDSGRLLIISSHDREVEKVATEVVEVNKLSEN
ncbi:ATP-binding cassette domain-containing protein [Fervidicoccus fontis]|uniref:ATP-binding cassette domain-containing protein n=1 Tax=Fervidicoccus fontis TaxID=683846 RepID=A0A7C2ZP53_9CREN|nr:ATP-binding cassette domain-containing protein [Fervidicoccus fontis]HEW64256.1 ATP-binding cassette domain-containing protein [Fervidicoccus fontis]